MRPTSATKLSAKQDHDTGTLRVVNSCWWRFSGRWIHSAEWIVFNCKKYHYLFDYLVNNMPYQFWNIIPPLILHAADVKYLWFWSAFCENWLCWRVGTSFSSVDRFKKFTVCNRTKLLILHIHYFCLVAGGACQTEVASFCDWQRGGPRCMDQCIDSGSNSAEWRWPWQVYCAVYSFRVIFHISVISSSYVVNISIACKFLWILS